MLQTIRDRLTGWVAGIIFFLIGLAFVFWGIDIGGANLNYAAKVNGEDIPINEFRRQQQNQLSQYAQFYPGGVPQEVENRLRQTLLDAFISQELIRQRSDEMGYRVGDQAVAEAIRSIPSFQVDGEFSMDLYQARLAGQGLSAAGFEARMRQSMRSEQLQRGLSASSFVTPRQLAAYVALQDQQREVSWVEFPATAYFDAAQVSEEEIVAEYESNPDAYMSPETVDIEYVLLPRAGMADDFTATDEELREYYEQELAVGRFRGAEQRRVSHILIAVDDDTDDAAAAELADEVFAKIEAGEDFAALAREFSDDPGSAEQGGDLGWSEPDAYVPAFREAIMSIEPGALTGPVRTEFGYHVIRLEGARGETDKPFDEVRPELLAELREAEVESRFYERAEELRRSAFEAFNELAPVAEAMDLEVATIAAVTRDSGSGIASNAEVREVAFSDPVMLDSENSEVIELPDGDAVVLRVTDSQPATVLPLDQVRARITSRLKRVRAEELAMAAGQAELERRRASGKLIDDALPAAARANEPRYVGRSEPGLARDLLEAVFAAPRPGATPYLNGLTLANGDYAVYAVHAVRPGDVSALSEEERNSRREQLAGRLGSQELAAYLGELRNSARIRVNEEQLN